MRRIKVLFISIFIFSIQANLLSQKQSTFSKIIADAGMSRGVTVEETLDDGFILTGVTTGGLYGGDDILLIKTDEKGDTLWRRTYGDKGNESGWAVRQTEDQGFIIAGYTDSHGNGGMDVFLMKTDPLGNALWTKNYGGAGDEYGWDIRLTKDGGYIIAAQTSSYGNGDIDACLIKVDSSGKEEWMKTYGGKNVDRIFSVQQTPDGGFIGAGITYSFNSVSPNDRDGYFIKTDASGKLEWYKTFGEDLYDVLHSVALTNDDGYFFTGYGESYAESGYRDVYLLNTDNMGNTNWLKVVGTPGEERGIKGVQTIDGGYIAVGITSEQRDLYLIRLDNRGELLWTRNLGDQKTIEFGYTVRETRDGGFILTGHQQSFTNDLRNIILIKTDSRGQVTDKE